MLCINYRETESQRQNFIKFLRQDTKENVLNTQQFLLRSLDLRNKVGFASKESDCKVQYNMMNHSWSHSRQGYETRYILVAKLRPILRFIWRGINEKCQEART
jgi:hypothetical protein